MSSIQEGTAKAIVRYWNEMITYNGGREIANSSRRSHMGCEGFCFLRRKVLDPRCRMQFGQVPVHNKIQLLRVGC